MQRNIAARDSRLLFATLGANGLFSVASGLALLAAAAPLAAWIAFPGPLWLRLVGAGLLGFGAAVLWLSRRSEVSTVSVLTVSALDLGWVVATVALALGVPALFNAAGVTLVIAIALIVLAFFELQVYALWRRHRVAA